MNLVVLDQLAQRQAGVISMEQTGWSRGAWYRALRSGQLVQVHPGVARLVGAAATERQRIQAATLAVPGSIASHRSAALLWGFVGERRSVASTIVHLSTPRSDARRDALVDVVVHRPDDLHEIRPVSRFGIPATPPLRTLVDLGITDRRLVHRAVGVALAEKILTINGLEAGLRRHARQGRTGVVALRTAIDDWALDARPADSVLEGAFAELRERFQLPPVIFHARIGRWEVDFRFVDSAVVVECDGWTTHGREQAQFERDRRKDDDLRAAGWVPARFSYRAITQRPADTARRLRRLLDRWSDLPPPDAT